jgi:hypothetical protein
VSKREIGQNVQLLLREPQYEEQKEIVDRETEGEGHKFCTLDYCEGEKEKADR